MIIRSGVPGIYGLLKTHVVPDEKTGAPPNQPVSHNAFTKTSRFYERQAPRLLTAICNFRHILSKLGPDPLSSQVIAASPIENQHNFKLK